MRGYLVLSCVLLVAFAAKLDLDPLDNLNEEEFEQEFHLDPVMAPEEKLRREEALVENENLIKETNLTRSISMGKSPVFQLIQKY